MNTECSRLRDAGFPRKPGLQGGNYGVSGRAWVGIYDAPGRRGANVARSFFQFVRFLCVFSQKKAGNIFRITSKRFDSSS